MRVPPHAGPGEVGVGQEAPLSVERRTVAVETRGEEDHDVGLLATAIFDLLVGDFVEGQGGDRLPHLEGPADRLVRVVLADLRGVVLDAEGEYGDTVTRRSLHALVHCHVFSHFRVCHHVFFTFYIFIPPYS